MDIAREGCTVDTHALRTQVCPILQPVMLGGFSFQFQTLHTPPTCIVKKTQSLDAEGNHAPSHVPTAVRLTTNRKVGSKVVPGSRDRRDGIVQVEQSRCARTLAGSAAPHWLVLSLL